MNSRLKMLAWPLGLILVIGLYFSENIKGHYRFKQMCAKDGGLTVHKPLERDQVHVGDETTGGQYLASFRGVKVGRAKDPVSGQWFDYKLTTGHPTGGLSKYEKTPADLTQVARYKWVRNSITFKDEIRLARHGYDIYDLQTGKVTVTYNTYAYQYFDPEKVFLASGAGSAATCPELAFDTTSLAIETAFINK
jgi:hypothetical protein